VHDRLPATLQGRVAMTGAHLAVLALVVMAALALTVWWVSRASGQEAAVAPVAVGTAGALVPVPASATPSTGSAAPTTPSAPASVAAPPGGTIVVDVAGKVRRPGIATLPQGSRVVDALEAAGGMRPGARLHGLNLARVLTDGEQVVVGVSAPPGVAASAAAAPTPGSATPMVDINTATEAQLEELPGVGPVTAQAILDYRTENGAFTAVDQLLEVSGIGDATLADLAPYVTL
jgi:competence protein ComEA